jgi:putative DNA primase/helicase
VADHRLERIAEAAIAQAVAAQTFAAVTVNLADVVPQSVDWLWSGWIPQARLSLVIGHAGQGKSWLTLALAAAVSRGWALPGDDRPRQARGVLLIGAEDGLADTVRPRLDALDADVRRIVALEGVTTERGERGFLLSDAGPLEELLASGDFGLVVIDPLTAFAGGADSYKDAEVRGLLAPLAQVAERYGPAIVGVMHLRKGQADTALQRASGSIAWGAAARSVFAVGTDPQAEDGTAERHVLPVKHNLCPAPEGVTFSLEAGRFTWGGPSRLSAAQLMAATGQGGEEGGALAEAEDVLRQILANGPVSAKTALRAAADAGVSEPSIRRARQALGVTARKEGFAGGWLWVPSEGVSQPPKASSQDTPSRSTLPKTSEAVIYARADALGNLDALAAQEPAPAPARNGHRNPGPEAEGRQEEPKDAMQNSWRSSGDLGALRPEEPAPPAAGGTPTTWPDGSPYRPPGTKSDGLGRVTGQDLGRALRALTGDSWEPFPLEALMTGPDGSPQA